MAFLGLFMNYDLYLPFFKNTSSLNLLWKETGKKTGTVQARSIIISYRKKPDAQLELCDKSKPRIKPGLLRQRTIALPLAPPPQPSNRDIIN